MKTLLLAINLALVSIAQAQNTWLPRGPHTWWEDVAASADGQRMVAAAYGDNLYLSTDAGNTWNGASSGAPFGFGWFSVASSADATNLLASGAFTSPIYVSTSAGANWRVSLATNGNWIPLFVSADGRKMVAGTTASDGKIFYSADAGSTWTRATVPQTWWRGLCGTADGSTLWCADNNLGKIYKSTDSGATWNVLPASPQDYWVRMSCSTNGSIIFAESNGGNNPAHIFISTDSGTNWVLSGAPLGIWGALACSGDGRIVIAGAQDIGIYSSTDFGATWVPDNAPTNVFWTGMACSANGSKMAATATSMSPGLPNEYIYINVVPMPPLNIAASGTNVILSWPTNATGFRLTGNANLNTTNWVSVTNALNVSNDLNQVTLPANGSARFFRLQNP